jgi:cyclase
VLAASIFHWGPDDMLAQVKKAIREAGFEVR